MHVRPEAFCTIPILSLQQSLLLREERLDVCIRRLGVEGTRNQGMSVS
jgi:hypothetical protein